MRARGRAILTKKRGRWLLALALVLLAGVAYGPAVAGAGAMDADRSLVLLMAERFARGELSLYFWQQNYMAAFEPLLLTPLAMVGGLTPTTATLVALALTAGLVALSAALASSFGGAVWLTALFWALPPAVVVHHHTALYGARLAATVLALGGFALALRVRSRRGWVAAGILTGLAYLGDHLMIGWAAGVVFVALARGGLRWLSLGALPPVLLDAVAAASTAAVHLAGPNDPGAWLRTPWTLVSVTLPQLFGLLWSRPPGPTFVPLPPVVPGGRAWLAVVVVGGAALVALFLPWLLERLRRLRPTGGLAVEPSDPGVGAGPVGLLLVCLASVLVFLFVGGDGERWPVRYLVPLWPAVSVLAGLAVTRWRPPLRPLAALALLPAAYTLQTEPSWPRGPDADLREEMEQVTRALGDAEVEAVAGEYWDVYRVARVVGDTIPWSSLSVIDRRPDWSRKLRGADRIGYLVRPSDSLRRAVLDPLAREGTPGEGPVPTARPAGPFRLYVASRPVPGLDTRTSAPSPAWSSLAALAASSLFLGLLAVAGLLARLGPWRSGPERAGQPPGTSR